MLYLSIFSVNTVLRITIQAVTRERFIFLVTITCFIQFTTTFVMTLSSVYYQVNALNNFLTRYNQNPESIPHMHMKKASKMFDKLCDLCDSISEFYLICNLTCLFAFVFFNVLFFYVLFVYIRNHTEILIVCLLGLSMWCFYYLIYVLYVVTISNWIQSDGCKVSDRIQKLAQRNNSLISLRSSYVMMLHEYHRRPRITCGYDVNWKMFFVLIGIIFSSSVIIIQFYDVSNISEFSKT